MSFIVFLTITLQGRISHGPLFAVICLKYARACEQFASMLQAGVAKGFSQICYVPVHSLRAYPLTSKSLQDSISILPSLKLT